VVPGSQGVAGNEKADESAKIAAEEPDARGVEWLSYLDRNKVRGVPLPRSLAHLKREISEKKWVEARLDKIPDAEKPEAGWHGCREHQEACLAVLPGEDGALPFREVPPLDEEPAHPAVLVVLVPDSDSGEHLFKVCPE